MGETPTFAEVVARNAYLLSSYHSIGGGGNNNLHSCNSLHSAMTVLAGSQRFVTTIATTATLDRIGSTCFYTTVRLPGAESYANAVKSQSVKLDGVPVNPVKVVGCVESVTNSTMQEQESVLSSWADDDQCFLDSINISWEKDKGAREPLQGRESSNIAGGGGFRRGRGQRGWRIIGGGEGGRRRKGPKNSNLKGNIRWGNDAQSPNISGGRFASLR